MHQLNNFYSVCVHYYWHILLWHSKVIWQKMPSVWHVKFGYFLFSNLKFNSQNSIYIPSLDTAAGCEMDDKWERQRSDSWL